jgi:hypothetical protein
LTAFLEDEGIADVNDLVGAAHNEQSVIPLNKELISA